MRLIIITLISLCGVYISAFTAHMQTAVFSRTSPLAASNANVLQPLKPGSSVALVTPFVKDSGSVDYNALRNLLRYHVEQGTDNLCILGTTGEANTLELSERKKVLEIAVEEVKGKMPILAGTGTINPEKVKAMTQIAMDIGCDAALVVTPYYVKPPQRCLIDFMTSIADVGLPVCIYNVPGRTAVDMLDESIAIAATHENIVAVKDATGKLERVKSLKAELEKNNVNDFLLFSGDDSTSGDFVLDGGDGCISVTANIAPNAMHRLIVAANAGDAKLTNEINAPLDILHKKLFVEANPIPIKWATYKMGLIDTPYCRPPLGPLDPKLEPIVEDALRQSGLLQ